MARRVLITGASGFVGANLARRLLSEGHDVACLLRPDARTWRLEEILDHVRRIEADLRDRDAVRRAVESVRPEWIFHLAAYGAYSWEQDLDVMIDVNVRGTVHLVEACARCGFESLVVTGSSSEYGFKDHAPSEDELPEPNSSYALAKVSATLYCRHIAQKDRLPVRTLRLYSVYGPWEDPGRLMPTLITLGLEGKLPPLVDPDVARDYVYTDDVCDAYVLAAREPHQEPGAVYNVGTGTMTTVRQVVDIARARLPIAAEPQWGTMPDRTWDTSVWVSDPRRIHASLGWAARIPFADGFARTVDWFERHPQVLDRYRRRAR